MGKRPARARRRRAGQDLDRGDGLDRLAQPHVVGDQAAAGPGGEHCALTLVSVQRYSQKLIEPRTVDSLGKRLLQPPAPIILVAHLGHEAHHIFMATQIMLDLLGRGKKMLESRKSLRTKYAAGVKKILCQPIQSRRPVVCQPQANFPMGAITEVDLAVRRTEPLTQCRRCARLPSQLRQRKLDVLARAQRVGGKVWTRAEIVGQAAASDHQAIGVPALWVGDLEIGEDGVVTNVFQLEFLFPSKLFPKRDLPCLQCQMVRFVRP